MRLVSGSTGGKGQCLPAEHLQVGICSGPAGNREGHRTEQNLSGDDGLSATGSGS